MPFSFAYNLSQYTLSIRPDDDGAFKDLLPTRTGMPSTLKAVDFHVLSIHLLTFTQSRSRDMLKINYDRYYIVPMSVAFCLFLSPGFCVGKGRLFDPSVRVFVISSLDNILWWNCCITIRYFFVTWTQQLSLHVKNLTQLPIACARSVKLFAKETECCFR